MPFGGEGLLKIPWDSPCMRIILKLLNTLRWILKNYRNSLPLHRVDQLVRSAKKWDAVLSIWTGDQTHTEWYHTVKAFVCFRELLPKILGSSNKLVKRLNVVKRRTIIIWELNTCRNFVNLRTEDFFVDRCRSKIYTMWKYYQNIYNKIYTMNM